MKRHSPEGLLLAFDFDNTQFRTSEMAPGIASVPVAYEQTVERMFGKMGLNLYLAQGGLRNRAPSEVVKALVTGSSARNNAKLVNLAGEFAHQNLELLDGYVPVGKGYELDLTKPLTTEALTEIFVRQKQRSMMPQIGMKLSEKDIWPRPCRGFVDFWKTVDDLKKEGVPITTANISSGHELFIEETFKKHGLSQPDIIVSEDDIRGVSSLDGKNIVKPSPFSLALAVRRWLDLPGFPHDDLDLSLIHEHADKVIYFGDDPVKDGQMAVAGNVLFGNYQEVATPPKGVNSFSFSNWHVLGQILRQKVGRKSVYTT